MCWFSNSKGRLRLGNDRTAEGILNDAVACIRSLLEIQTETKELDILGKITGNWELFTGLW
jgi:hypothetical protein